MRILIAEDDETTALFIARNLQELGHDVMRSATGPDALAQARGDAFDAIVLDRMMPGLDGIEVLSRSRAAGVSTPILILTALGRTEDRVHGLEAGADDYLVKPFAISELVARLNAIVRRGAAGDSVTSLRVGPLVMDILRREVRHGGRLIVLQPREFRLLEELMRGAGRIVTRTMLLESVWGFHFDPQTNIVETHVSRLRGKLALGGASHVIETVRGAGYRMRTVARE